jgi:chromosome segregation ATPase
VAVADLIAKVRNRGRAAVKSAKQLAVSIVEGTEATDEQITEACREAGLAYEQFADLVAKAEARKAAFDEYHAHDFDNEIAEAKKAYRQTVAEHDAVKAEITALMEESRRLGGLCESLAGHPNRIEAQKKEAVKKFQAALGSTPSDWRLL